MNRSDGILKPVEVLRCACKSCTGTFPIKARVIDSINLMFSDCNHVGHNKSRELYMSSVLYGTNDRVLCKIHVLIFIKPEHYK